jgi:YfiH family protein
MNLHDGVLISEVLNDLPVTHGFTTRLRGDLGPSRPQIDAAVIARRAALFEDFGLAGRRHIQPKQVHSNHLVAAGEFFPGCEADAGLSHSSGDVVSVLTADCVPLLLYHPDGVVCAIHGGWRGLYAGVVSRSLLQLPPHPTAVIGPAIGVCCYEVSRELAADFENRFGAATVDRSREKPHLNLVAVALRQLQDGGVEELEASHLCTSCHPELFYSYRREGSCGRMMAFIGLKPTLVGSPS